MEHCTGPQMISKLNRKWFRTENDADIAPQMIPDRNWSPFWTANDPDPKIKNGMDLSERKEEGENKHKNYKLKYMFFI